MAPVSAIWSFFVLWKLPCQYWGSQCVAYRGLVSTKTTQFESFVNICLWAFKVTLVSRINLECTMSWWILHTNLFIPLRSLFLCSFTSSFMLLHTVQTLLLPVLLAFTQDFVTNNVKAMKRWPSSSLQLLALCYSHSFNNELQSLDKTVMALSSEAAEMVHHGFVDVDCWQSLNQIRKWAYTWLGVILENYNYNTWHSYASTRRNLAAG